MHPRVLGGARPVAAAGEIAVDELGEVISLDNASGTFQCHPDSLLTVVGGLIEQGATIDPDVIHRYEV
jgi:hypothetical protein